MENMLEMRMPPSTMTLNTAALYSLKMLLLLLFLWYCFSIKQHNNTKTTIIAIAIENIKLHQQKSIKIIETFSK